jgi:hypothetical protein
MLTILVRRTASADTLVTADFGPVESQGGTSHKAYKSAPRVVTDLACFHPTIDPLYLSQDSVTFEVMSRSNQQERWTR